MLAALTGSAAPWGPLKELDEILGKGRMYYFFKDLFYFSNNFIEITLT